MSFKYCARKIAIRFDAAGAHSAGVNPVGDHQPQTTSLLPTEQSNGHEGDFTLLLHRVLHPEAHLSEEQNLSRIKEIADLKSWTRHAAQNWVRPERPHRAAKSRPDTFELRGSLPHLAAGIRRSYFGQAGEGSSKFCKTGCKTKPKRGTKVTHGNHQRTTQTTQVSDDPSSY